MGEKVLEIRSINSMYKIHGEVKNSMGNVEANERIRTTHGHELRWWNDGRSGCAGWKRIKGRTNRTIVIA